MAPTAAFEAPEASASIRALLTEGRDAVEKFSAANGLTRRHAAPEETSPGFALFAGKFGRGGFAPVRGGSIAEAGNDWDIHEREWDWQGSCGQHVMEFRSSGNTGVKTQCPIPSGPRPFT